MSKVVLSGHILVPDADLGEILAELPRHIRLTRQEAGCIVFDVIRNSDNPARFDVYEEFSSDDAFRLHQRRVSGSHWGRISSNLERHYTIEGLQHP